MIMEAGRSHSLPCTSWSPRRASGATLAQTQMSGKQEDWRGKSQSKWEAQEPRGLCPKTGEGGCPSLGRDQIHPPSALLLCSGPSGPDKAHPIDEVDLLSIKMLTSSGDSLTDTPRNKVLSALGHPSAQIR